MVKKTCARRAAGILCVALVCALGVVGQPGEVAAQSLGDMAKASKPADKGGEKKAEGKRDPREFGPGTFDLSIGAGGLFYPHIEPGLDIGLIPIADRNVVLSIGGSLELGYCLGCKLFDIAARLSGSDLSVTSWYVLPFLRANAHLNAVGRLIKMPELDVYAGLMAGPGYYSFKVESSSDNAKVDYTSVTGTVGPVLGLRYLFGKRGFVGFEARYLVTVGHEDVVLKDSSGNVIQTFNGSDVARNGTDYQVSVGVRF